MQRLIPRKTKVKLEFLKGITVLDLILAAVGVAGFIVLILANQIPFSIALVFAIVWVSLFFKVSEDERFYTTIVYLFRFFAQKKKFSANKKNGKKSEIDEIIPFEKIQQGRFIDFGGYYAQVVEVTPVFFGLLNEYTQDAVIESFANAIRRLTPDQTCSIMKLNRAMVLDNYIHNENKKYELLLDMQYEGNFTEEEVSSRSPIFEERVSFLENMNRREKVYKDHFYVVVFDRDRDMLENTTNGIVSSLATSISPIASKKLEGNELAIFLKANYGR
ncbi:MAG: hypothetical protein IJ937_09895, partial [Treponema sp.]|nr:hypothetical protein [Treponema sp.]